MTSSLNSRFRDMKFGMTWKIMPKFAQREFPGKTRMFAREFLNRGIFSNERESRMPFLRYIGISRIIAYGILYGIRREWPQQGKGKVKGADFISIRVVVRFFRDSIRDIATPDHVCNCAFINNAHGIAQPRNLL